jgi:hypothetical protein
MAMILIPVLLSTLLGPGMGQLYNREFKKGFVLIAISLGLLVAFSIWLSRAAMVYLPSDINAVDREVLRSIIQDHIVKEHTGTFYTYEILLAAIWVYGVIDSYLGGMRRRSGTIVSPTVQS